MNQVKLISRTFEQRDLGAAGDRLRLEIGTDRPLLLNLDVYRTGCSFRTEVERYCHPAPPFCRLFRFRGETSGGMVTIDGRKYSFVPDRIYLLNAEHPFEVVYTPGVSLYYAHFLLTDGARRSVFSESPGLVSIHQVELNRYFDSCWTAGRFGSRSAALIGGLFEFLETIQERLLLRQELFRAFSPMLTVLENTPVAQVRVAELAEAMGMTPSALSRIFLRKVGVPLKQYLDQRYLQRATELLIRTEWRLTEVAECLGHHDPHYFYHAFHRIAGLSPGEYRKRWTHAPDV